MRKIRSRIFDAIDSTEQLWVLSIVLVLAVFTLFLLPQPVPELTPQTITILNPHSLPRVGGEWTIYFNTTGVGELKINDHAFPDEVDFVDLYRHTGQNWWRVPVSITGDLIIANWTYPFGKAIFHVKTPEEHVLEFIYGDRVAYAYNRAELYVSIGVPKSAARGQKIPVYGSARNHNLSDVTLIYNIPGEFTVTGGETTKTCGDAYLCENNLTLDTADVPTGTYIITLDACTFGVCGTSSAEVKVDRLVVEPEEPKFDRVKVGEPVKWSQKYILKNPFNKYVYNYTIPVPKDAFGIEPGVISEVKPNETLPVDVTFYTLPVEVTVQNENLYLERMIPKEASKIKVRDTEGLLFSPIDYEMLRSLNINFPAERVLVRHNASLHYQNIPVAVPSAAESASLFEDVNGTLETVGFTIRENTVAWIVPHLSTRIYWIAPETYQVKKVRGNKTYWTLEIENIKTEYETKTGNLTTGLINKTWAQNVQKQKHIKIRAAKTQFRADEAPAFDIELTGDKKIKVRIEDAMGRLSFANPKITKTAKGRYTVQVRRARGFQPGLHKLIIETSEGTEELWFTWGLISINTRKGLYHPGEEAEIIMVVLDKDGHLVSGAQVNLTVTSPKGDPRDFSTSAGSVIETQIGIYRAYYVTTTEGMYTMFAEASAAGVTSDIESYFLAKNYYEFEILRDVPVTIDPQRGPFESKIKIVSNSEANG
ncbi:MAG: hypothetical protein V3R86_06395, partial [Candidatus Hydrothermarchaeaceae archaeon]